MEDVEPKVIPLAMMRRLKELAANPALHMFIDDAESDVIAAVAMIASGAAAQLKGAGLSDREAIACASQFVHRACGVVELMTKEQLGDGPLSA